MGSSVGLCNTVTCSKEFAFEVWNNILAIGWVFPLCTEWSPCRSCCTRDEAYADVDDDI